MLADEDPELAKKMGVIKSDEPEESTAREKTGDEKDEENDLEGQIKEIVEKFTSQLDSEMKVKLQEQKDALLFQMESGFKRSKG